MNNNEEMYEDWLDRPHLTPILSRPTGNSYSRPCKDLPIYGSDSAPSAMEASLLACR